MITLGNGMLFIEKGNARIAIGSVGSMAVYARGGGIRTNLLPTSQKGVKVIFKSLGLSDIGMTFQAVFVGNRMGEFGGLGVIAAGKREEIMGAQLERRDSSFDPFAAMALNAGYRLLCLGME